MCSHAESVSQSVCQSVQYSTVLGDGREVENGRRGQREHNTTISQVGTDWSSTRDIMLSMRGAECREGLEGVNILESHCVCCGWKGRRCIIIDVCFTLHPSLSAAADPSHACTAHNRPDASPSHIYHTHIMRRRDTWITFPLSPSLPLLISFCFTSQLLLQIILGYGNELSSGVHSSTPSVPSQLEAAYTHTRM